jgi:hypothetical protein
MELDDKTVQRFRKLTFRLDRVKSEVDGSYSSLSTTMKDALTEITNVCQLYRNMIAEQNRAMVKMATDFQQQVAQLARNFQTQISDLDQSYRGFAYGAVPQPPLLLPAPAPSSRRNLIRRKPPEYDSEDDYIDSEHSSEGDDIERNVQLWKQDSQKTRSRRSNRSART